MNLRRRDEDPEPRFAAWNEVFVAIVHIGHTMIVEVLLRPFDAVMEPLPLDLTELTRRHIPVIMMVIILRVGCRR